MGIPNDPSNQTRALVILRDQGLITLKDGFDPATGTATLADVTSNPRKLDFVESASVAVLIGRLGRLPCVRMRTICNALAIAVDCSAQYCGRRSDLVQGGRESARW